MSDLSGWSKFELFVGEGLTANSQESERITNHFTAIATSTSLRAVLNRVALQQTTSRYIVDNSFRFYLLLCVPQSTTGSNPVQFQSSTLQGAANVAWDFKVVSTFLSFYGSPCAAFFLLKNVL